MRTHHKVVAVANIKGGEPVIVMNGLARPAYEREPTTVISLEEFRQGEVMIYDPVDRTLRRKR